jgi:hypothetical protein
MKYMIKTRPKVVKRAARPGLFYKDKPCLVCGTNHAMAPSGAIVCGAGHLWFNCSCGSTHFVRNGEHNL